MAFPKKEMLWIDDNMKIFTKNNIITLKYTCKLCDDSIFGARDEAELHVDIHLCLTKEDLFKQVGRRYICKICNAFLDETNLALHYPLHKYLYDSNQPRSMLLQRYKSQLLKPIIVCNICKLKITSKELMHTHISEKHVTCFSTLCHTYKEYVVRHPDNRCNHKCKFGNNNLAGSSAIDKPSKSVNNTTTIIKPETTIVKPETTIVKTETTIIVDDDVIVVKHLLEDVGITDQSKTSALSKFVCNEIPKDIYSCSFCPHRIFLLHNHIKRHMRKTHGLLENHQIYTTTVPMELILENRQPGEENIIFKCPCQFTSFSNELLSEAALTKIYCDVIKSTKNNPFLYNNDHECIDAKTKLSRIYKVQFTCHSRGIIIIKKENNNNCVSSNKRKRIKTPSPIECIIIPDEDELSIEDVTEIEPLSEELNNDNEDMIVIKNFLNKIGFIGCNGKTVQSKVVKKIPSDLYSCFLCPHVTIFSSEDLKFHMSSKHNLMEEYSKLISVVSAKSLIESKVLKADHDELYILKCICEKSVFNKEVLTMSIIEEIYRKSIVTKELTDGNDDRNISVENKLLRIYWCDNPNHNKHMLVVNPHSYGQERTLDSDNEIGSPKLHKK